MKMQKLTAAMIVSTVILVGGTVGHAQIGLVTTDPTLPPLDPAVYLNPTNVHELFEGPALDIILEKPEHKAILVELRERLQSPASGEREIFESTLDGTAQVCPNGVCGPSIPFTLTGPVETHVFGKDPTDTTGSWDTEMVSMQLTGNVGGNPVIIQESPSLPSQGHTTITDIGGGQFQIDSFFDVFTEISLDGGNNFIPMTGGPTHVVLMPEPSSLLLVGLGLVGVLSRRVKRRD